MNFATVSAPALTAFWGVARAVYQTAISAPQGYQLSR